MLGLTCLPTRWSDWVLIYAYILWSLNMDLTRGRYERGLAIALLMTLWWVLQRSGLRDGIGAGDARTARVAAVLKGTALVASAGCYLFLGRYALLICGLSVIPMAVGSILAWRVDSGVDAPMPRFNREAMLAGWVCWACILVLSLRPHAMNLLIILIVHLGVWAFAMQRNARLVCEKVGETHTDKMVGTIYDFRYREGRPGKRLLAALTLPAGLLGAIFLVSEAGVLWFNR